MVTHYLRKILLGIILAASSVPIIALANSNFQPVSILKSVTTGSPIFGDGYGETVKFNGDYLFVAAPFARPSGPSDVVSGAIYVYHRQGNQWVNTQIIETLGEGDHDGALKIDSQGPWLMFSALGTPIGPVIPPNVVCPSDPTQSGDVVCNQDFRGSVQIYKLNPKTSKWEFSQSLDSSLPGLQNLTTISPAAFNPAIPFFLNEQGAAFGLNFSLSALTGTLLVGAEYQQNTDAHNNPLINSGDLYAFKLNPFTQKWYFTQVISNPDGVAQNDAFGYNVVQNGLVAIVSNGPFLQQPKLGPVAANSNVYVYNYDGISWRYVQKIHGDQSTLPIVSVLAGSPFPSGDAFGESLAMNGLWVMIGAPLESKDPVNATNSGAVYFYKLYLDRLNIKLQREQKVYSDDALAYETGLINIALDGDIAVISDPGRTGPNADYQGGAMVFKLKPNGTWVQQTTLYDPNGSANSFFGGGVDVQDGLIAVGGIPFVGIAPVATLNVLVGPPYHHSLLLPILPVPNPPVILYQGN